MCSTAGRSSSTDSNRGWRRLAFPGRWLESGQLDLSDGTFRRTAKSYPVVSPLRELRSALSDLRLNDLAVGRDGRNRTILSAFRSRTGRNQPSNSRYIFGPSVWLRGLIAPPPGHGVAYVDWSQQEFGIAAALSGDLAMQAAYLSGDPYLAFAKQAGAVHQGNPRAAARAVQAMRSGRAVRHGQRRTGVTNRQATCGCARLIAGPLRNLSDVLGVVRLRR
jgi:hypothetical protein